MDNIERKSSRKSRYIMLRSEQASVSPGDLIAVIELNARSWSALHCSSS